MARGTKYIYHSENTNSTCNDCKKHDNEVYYDIKDIPKLPIHPNCRCWIETVDVSVSNNSKCDCRDRIKVIKNNVENAVINIQTLLDSVDNYCLDIEIDFENISNILENLNVKKDEIYDEIGKHNKDCKNNVDNLYKEIEDNINNLKLLNNKSEKISDKTYSLRRNSSSFLDKAKNKLVDINITEEYLDKTYHTKGECKSNNKLKEHSKSVSDICSSVDDYWHKFKSLKDEIKKIEDTIKDNKKVIGFIKNKKHLPCSCKISEVVLKGSVEIKEKATKIKNDICDNVNRPISDLFVIAGSNLQDSLNDFEYAKKNKHAHILNSRSNIKNKDINKVLDEVKVPKNSRGVYYDINSEQSKAIFNTNKLQEEISKNKNKWKIANRIVHDIKFEQFIDPDAYLSLQNCKMLNPHITPDGYFEAIIIDYWDFKYRDLIKLQDIKNFKDIGKNLANDINNWGYDKQKKGEMENFFVIYSIREKMK